MTDALSSRLNVPKSRILVACVDAITDDEARAIIARLESRIQTMSTIDVDHLSPQALAQRWLDLDPVMPEDGRPEMDEYGELFLSPLPANRHQNIASWVGWWLQNALGGRSIGSLAISTRIGVRVPDMCWTADPTPFMSDPSPTAPEICVEVASPSNSAKWLREKTGAYLAAGAREVIIVELDERIRYFTVAGEQPASSFGVSLTLPPG